MGGLVREQTFARLSKIMEKQKNTEIKNPNSTRPWQHVLDVLNGYMCFIKYAYYKKI